MKQMFMFEDCICQEVSLKMLIIQATDIHKKYNFKMGKPFLDLWKCFWVLSVQPARLRTFSVLELLLDRIRRVQTENNLKL